MQMYPLQMTDKPDDPFDKIATDLIMDLNVSGNQHILTIINHLTVWPEAFTIPDEKADTIVCVFRNNYLLAHMCTRYILSDNSTGFKNKFMDSILQQLGIDYIFSAHYHPWSNGKLEMFPQIPKSNT